MEKPIKFELEISDLQRGNIQTVKTFPGHFIDNLGDIGAKTDFGKAMKRVRNETDMMYNFSTPGAWNSMHYLLSHEPRTVLNLPNEWDKIGNHEMIPFTDEKGTSYSFYGNRMNPRTLTFASANEVCKEGLLSYLGVKMPEKIVEETENNHFAHLYSRVLELSPTFDHYRQPMEDLLALSSDFAALTLAGFFIMNPEAKRIVERDYGEVKFNAKVKKS